MMKCISPVKTRNKETGDWLDYPCGQCMACRITRRQEWTLRLMLEMGEHEYSYFVTLTYNDENLPENGSLKKKDLQKFLKRLRFKHKSKTIRYFACGEYGDKKKRPHYHVIVMTEEDMSIRFGRTKGGKTIIENSDFHSSWINDNKPIGHVDIAIIPSHGDGVRIAQYVAGYTVKKYTGSGVYKRTIKQDGVYNEYCEIEFKDREPEFATMSRKPGIGFKSIKRLVSNLKKYSVGTKYQDVENKTGIHVLRLHGKLWPVSRTLREKIVKELGEEFGANTLNHKDNKKLVDSTRRICYDYKSRQLHRRLVEDPSYRMDFEQATRETKARAEKAVKKNAKFKKDI